MEAISLSLRDHFCNFLGIPCVHLKVLFCHLDTNGINVTIYGSCLFINMVVLTIDKYLNLSINGTNINLITFSKKYDTYFKEIFGILIYFLNVDKIYLQSNF
jgi:NADH:ubiquinone oxidoreductase subunit K